MNNKEVKNENWDELLNAGYLTELTEEQIGIAKHKLNPTPDWEFRGPEGDMDASHALEAKMRGLTK